MYKINILGFEKLYLMEELIKVFLKEDEYILKGEPVILDGYKNINTVFSEDKDAIKRELYSYLKQVTNKEYPYGILTGIRPVKLAGEAYERFLSKEIENNSDKKSLSMAIARKKTLEYLQEKYLVSPEKAAFLVGMYWFQTEKLGYAATDSISLYVGIPFCPTRCSYCSFASHQGCEGDYDSYVDALIKEIEYCGNKSKEMGLWTESLYIGGGTPTSLNHVQLKRLIEAIREYFDLSKLKEFTCECGRPDTIDEERLSVLRELGVDRISINPQSLKEETLKVIGRSHSVCDFYEAYNLARKMGFSNINCDLIAGLPGEEPNDFKKTLDGILKLSPADITVHTLAVKRASKLVELDREYHYKQEENVKEMVSYASNILIEAGYHPYYLYRQKHMAGALENTGYCMDGCDGLYNVRIMDEHQSILAMGAGGISKRYFPEENRLERIANVSNYKIYIDRIEDMIKRKEIEFFGR